MLYLVKEGLLDIPVLYLSRQILRTKDRYYALQQQTREADMREDWVVYMLDAVAKTAEQGIGTVIAVRSALLDVKHHVRKEHKFYSRDLIKSLFSHPYTTVQYFASQLHVSRRTATKYFDALAVSGVLDTHRMGRANVYVNVRLVAVLTGTERDP